MCFTSLYIYILDLFTPSLQFIFLFCFYEMLNVEDDNLFLFRGTFCQMALYCVCVVPEQYTIPLLPCSVYDLSVVFCVSCTVKALYKCPSPFWALVTKALFNMFFCLTKKRVKVEAEEAGGEGRDCKAKTPQQLSSRPHLSTLLDF